MNSRSRSIYLWALTSAPARGECFRKFAHETIVINRKHLADAGLHHSAIEVYDFERTAVDRFVKIAIEQDRDDDEAVNAAQALVYSVSGASRGALPGFILLHGACGKRVRAALLKSSWSSGNSGSVLRLNGPGIDTIVDFFLEVEPSDLMASDELSKLASLGKNVRIYRGAKLEENNVRLASFAPSWTLDYDTARWFAIHGHGQIGAGVVLTAEIDKCGILALWETSNREPEAVVNPRRLRKVDISEKITKQEEIAAWK